VKYKTRHNIVRNWLFFSQFEMESLRYSYLHARYEYSRHRWLTCINVYTKNFAINQVWRNQIRKFIKNSFQFILVSTEILISMTQKKNPINLLRMSENFSFSSISFASFFVYFQYRHHFLMTRMIVEIMELNEETIKYYK